MKTVYSEYDPNTGEFIGVIGGGLDKIDIPPNSVEGTYTNHYIDLSTGEIKGKHKFWCVDAVITSDGVDSYSASVPESTHCLILQGLDVIFNNTIDDGVFEFSTDDTGLYSITLTHPHYEKHEFTIRAE